MDTVEGEPLSFSSWLQYEPSHLGVLKVSSYIVDLVDSDQT